MNILAITLCIGFGFIIGMAAMALLFVGVKDFKEERLEK